MLFWYIIHIALVFDSPLVDLTCTWFCVFQFLSRVSTLTRDTDIAIMSVRLFVTFRYWMKTAQHIVIVFSPYGSPIILVLSA